ncbi:conserved Plasmodium protein, unknown function [Plasmodium vinckei vinckei]|uniref:Protein FAM32A n=1 Tax=Plasmodium vinckei vinckei TaxID=54757 RepID=A0A449C0P4_PLAVN|nr:conserved Plasmodium protein, unknown function [Plasmodium vinckei vinckei]KEG03949.1 hypothetical protein YYE_00851 [Plasmodium vinckei vinckei]VEV59254.1 conserved Plasmodium protein, unknown function [Plasmodium vinckei vinckei]
MKDNEFVGGKLKLKGIKVKKNGNKKSDKKKHTKNDEDKYDIKKKTDYDHSDKENNYNSNDENKPEINFSNDDKNIQELLQLNLTESEKAYQLVLKKREKQRMENFLKESYRKRLQKFNDNLASLSEHFDIPKVGPG